MDHQMFKKYIILPSSIINIIDFVQYITYIRIKRKTLLIILLDKHELQNLSSVQRKTFSDNFFQKQNFSE